jgi:hypothetical protein
MVVAIEVLMDSCPRGLWRLGWPAGEGEERLVQAGLAERDLSDRHPGLGEPGHGVPDQAARVDRVGRGKQHGQGEGVGAEVDPAVQGGGQDRLGQGSLLAIDKPDVQRPRADPGLELGAGPFGRVRRRV